jgi:Tfp pilus assembly protein PilF
LGGAEWLREKQLLLSEGASLCYNVGYYLSRRAQYEQAEPLFLRALHIREQSLGPDHPQVASPLNNLAILYYQQGKFQEAEPLYQRALHIRKQSLGPDHPLTRQVRDNYTLLLQAANRQEAAKKLEENA